MENKFPKLKPMGAAEDVFKNIFLQTIEEAKKAKRKAYRILIPAVIVASLILIGIGIVIGKYIL